MRKLTTISRNEVYNAPIIDWNNGTYTPVSNKSIMDLIEDKINSINLVIKSEEYRASTDTDGNIRGVIGAYNIVTPNENYGQRIMFRNSYDKSMSFAFVEGTVVWINSQSLYIVICIE